MFFSNEIGERYWKSHFASDQVYGNTMPVCVTVGIREQGSTVWLKDLIRANLSGSELNRCIVFAASGKNRNLVYLLWTTLDRQSCDGAGMQLSHSRRNHTYRPELKTISCQSRTEMHCASLQRNCTLIFLVLCLFFFFFYFTFFSSLYKVGTITAHMSHTASFVSRTAVPLLQKQTI